MNAAPDAIADIPALARYVLSATDEVLSRDDTPLWATARLLDGLATTAHGASSELSRIARAVMRPAPHGAPPDGSVRVWPPSPDGEHTHYRWDDAAYLLGTYSFSLNYADTGLGSVAHPASIALPALLLAAQRTPTPGSDALAALVVGYGVVEALGTALNGGRPRMAHQIRGFRPTATVGPIAAAGILCRLAHASVTDTEQALALACHQGGGLRVYARSARSSIRLQSGEAMRRAVHCVDLARAGIETPASILDADGGFLDAYGCADDVRVAVPAAGDGTHIREVSIKIDCCPHTFMTVLDATRRLRAADPDGELPEAIEVSMPRQHHTISGAAVPLPTTFAEANYHIPYCVAVAFLRGGYLYPDLLTRNLRAPDVTALAGRVTVRDDDDLTRAFESDPRSWPATVTARGPGDRAVTVRMDQPAASAWSAAETLSRAAGKAALVLTGSTATADTFHDFAAGAHRWADTWRAISASTLFTPHGALA